MLISMCWQNGGTNCPVCRGVSTYVTTSRPLQSMVEVLLRSDPSRARTERERSQADEVYHHGQTIRVCDAPTVVADFVAAGIDHPFTHVRADPDAPRTDPRA